jgi:hypothetical protein
MSTLGSQEFPGGGGAWAGGGGGAGTGAGAAVVRGTVLVGSGPTLVGGGFPVVVACGAGGGVGLGSWGGGAIGVGRGAFVGPAVPVGRQCGGQPPTLVGGGFVVVVAFGASGWWALGSCGGGRSGPAPVTPGPAAFSFHVSWRLSGVTHTPSPTKASRHTYPGLQVRGPYAPPPGCRRSVAVAFSCAIWAATCWVTHTSSPGRALRGTRPFAHPLSASAGAGPTMIPSAATATEHSGSTPRRLTSFVMISPSEVKSPAEGRKIKGRLGVGSLCSRKLGLTLDGGHLTGRTTVCAERPSP